MLDVVIVGAGGFGREIYQWLQESLDPREYRFKGFLSNIPEDLDGFDIPGSILGDEDSYAVQETDRFVFAIGDVAVKKRMVRNLKSRGAQFMTFIHRTAIVAPTARLGEGVVICPFALVSDHVVLKDFVTLNFYASCGHDAQLGDFCILSPYATVNGWSILSSEVFMGTHATVVDRRKVGRGAKINANSVAMKDVPDHAFVFGVPGRVQMIFKD